MKTQVILACLILTTISAFAQATTIQFRRDGNTLIVTQNGTASTVSASNNNDFIVPVPDAPPAPQAAPAVSPSTPTITPAPTPVVTAPAPVASVHPKAPRTHSETASTPDASQPSMIQYAPRKLGDGGGVIISPSTLPSDSVPPLPASDMAQAGAGMPAGQPVTPKMTSPTPAATALSAAELRELNMYRTMLASPLRLTIENGAVTVKWNTAHGTVTIPDSHQIDIKLDRVIQTPSH